MRRNMMNSDINYEQEIDFRDLLFYVLHKWKIIILGAICIAFLFGGLKFKEVYKQQHDTAYVQKMQEEYKYSLGIYENSKNTYDQESLDLKNDIKQQQQYLSESILMNISPYNVCEASADLFIKTEFNDITQSTMDYIDSIMQAYQQALTSASFLEKVVETTDVKGQYLQELVTVERGKVHSSEEVMGRSTNILTIKVKNSDEQRAIDILNDILSQIDTLQVKFSEDIGTHSAKIINQSIDTIIDLSLVNQQQEAEKRLSSLQTSLNDKEKAIKELKKPETINTTKKAILKPTIKYGILGGILGAFVISFFAILAYLISDKLYSAKELKRCYKLRVLGSISVDNKKSAKGIDKWLNRLEGKINNSKKEIQYNIIVANICNHTEQSQTLLLTGTISNEQLNEIHKDLSLYFNDKKIVLGNNMLADGETIKKLLNCDGIILVEQVRKSHTAMISEEIDMAHNFDKKIVGCIVVE